MKFYRKQWVAGLLAAMSCYSAFAGPQGSQISIRAKIVAPPPCNINNGRTIDVDFGKIGVNSIDGSSYMQRLDYSVNCMNLDPARQLKMRILGTGAAFNTTLLRTSINGLGIKLLADGNPFNLNSTLNINHTRLPQLDAVPVKAGAANLTGGEFTSGATMQIDYF